MPKSHIKLFVAIALLVLPLRSQAALAPVLQFPFDAGLASSNGIQPLHSTQTQMVEGFLEGGVHIGTNGWIKYDASLLRSDAGTIMFWIRPDWDGSESRTHHFFQAGQSFNNGLVLAIDGACNLRFLMWGDDPATPEKETWLERGVGSSGYAWRAREWYHFAATWDSVSREMALYVNGVLLGSVTDGIAIDAFSTAHFTVSAENSGSDSAQAVFDDLRVYAGKLTAGEILREYNAAFGVGTLLTPRGLATDSAGQVYVAQSEVGDVQVFSAAGDALRTIGTPGTNSGQLLSPYDVALAGDSLYVVDSLNHRVQEFTTAGDFVRSFGARGSAPEQFQEPKGCGVDANGRLYVADTGNHRVQRFLANGVLDSTWGSQGVVGITGSVQRDHLGFDRPVDVAVNPVNQQVYIADYGNCRLEVYDPSGSYVRTYFAVFHPTALSFALNGDLYIAGEDPNEGYPPYDGRLRFLKAGDEFVSRHYTGGLDDLGRQLGGVCVTPNGSIIISDPMNGRLVRTDDAFAVPLDNLHTVCRGAEVQIQWKTRVPCRGAVRFGTSPSSASKAEESQSGLNHSITLTGLTPNTRLYYSVGFSDSFDGKRRWTPAELVNTGSLPGTHQFLRVKAAGLIYTDTSPGPGYTALSAADIAEMRSRFQKVAEFYWRNSGFKLWLDIEIIEIHRDITESAYNVWDSAQQDLAALGYSAADEFDAVWAASTLAGGNFGGGAGLFDRSVAMCEWVSQSDFVAIHEISHTIDSMYSMCGLPKYQFNHGIWAVPGAVGRDFAVNAQILRNMPSQSLTATSAPFTKVMTAPDADNDGLPDSSPDGLTTPLPITEQTLGSSITTPDSDGDGVADAAEAMALPAHGSSLLAADSDGDGVTDANDRNPMYRMQDHVMKASPLIDGLIATNEGWTVLTRNWGFTNDVLVTDANHLQAQITTYAAWDDNFIYLALKGPNCVSTVHLDGNADNWFMGSDNYLLTIGNNSDTLDVRVNVGVPDLFRQIDDDGQYSEFFDVDPQWVLPYQGRPFFNQPAEGAGYPGRLVTESEILYRHGGLSDTERVWEVAIPWNPRTSFRGGEGKSMALGYNIDGDILFETDHAATIKLVSSLAARSTAICYSPAGVELRWNAAPGVRYALYAAESVTGPWRYVKEIVGQGEATSFIDDGTLTGLSPGATTSRFYRFSPQP